MNNKEIMISKIRSNADRFDALSIYIESETFLTDNFITKMLFDKYYVNRAEILDYIISYRISDRFEKELLKLLKMEKSSLNFGRLRVCVALSSSGRLHRSLHKHKFPMYNLHDIAWYITAIILKENGSNKSNISYLISFTFSDDESLKSLSKSLIEMFFPQFLKGCD